MLSCSKITRGSAWTFQPLTTAAPLSSCWDDISYRMRSNDILSPATRRNDCCIRDGKWGFIKFTNLSVWWSSISRKFVNELLCLLRPVKTDYGRVRVYTNLFLRPLSNVILRFFPIIDAEAQGAGKSSSSRIPPDRGTPLFARLRLRDGSSTQR